MEIDYFIDKAEYYTHENLKVSEIDTNWNDYVVFVGDTVTVPMEITLIVNSKLEVTSIEINKIGKDYDHRLPPTW